MYYIVTNIAALFDTWMVVMVCLATDLYPWLAEQEDARGCSCTLPTPPQGICLQRFSDSSEAQNSGAFFFVAVKQISSIHSGVKTMPREFRGQQKDLPNKRAFDQIHVIHTIMTVVCLNMWVPWQATSGLLPMAPLGTEGLAGETPIQVAGREGFQWIPSCWRGSSWLKMVAIHDGHMDITRLKRICRICVQNV